MKISCIIPAYNEERTIANVIDSAKKSELFHEIIVVSDGSTDQTNEILRTQTGIIFINLEKNLGKGGAVWKGLEKSSGDIIVMLDADLIGVEKEHLKKLIEPLEKNEADVAIGIIAHSKRLWMSSVQLIGSNLSGQQAFRKHLVLDADFTQTRFGLEIALKNHFKKKGVIRKKILLSGVSHLMKEQKMGFGLGMHHRGKMYKEVGKEIQKNIKDKIKNISQV